MNLVPFFYNYSFWIFLYPPHPSSHVHPKVKVHAGVGSPFHINPRYYPRIGREKEIADRTEVFSNFYDSFLSLFS